MVSMSAGNRVVRLVLCLIVAAVFYGAVLEKASAAEICPDNGQALPATCTKEIRIYNNTAGPLWAVVQGSIQETDALNCTKADKGGGDVWLQAALGKTDSCLKIAHDYYIFTNPAGGIPKGGFISIQLPWWSKQTTAADKYIDWWRGGRVLMFDDKTAFEEAFKEQSARPQVDFAAGSAKPHCTTGMAGNTCATIQTYQVKTGTAIDTHLPYQLNEYTFADVAAVTDNGTKGGGFIDFYQNYNVSNVDQVYLPLAMEPVRQPADVGYMGTTIPVVQFKKLLTAFVKGGDAWPVYNNPVVSNAKKYPNAGIRVPAAQSVFAYYMNPGNFPDGKTPVMVPQTPPTLVQDMIDQWKNCTAASPKDCPQSAPYKAIDAIFLDNYKAYVATCGKIPGWLKPKSQNPAKPSDAAYLFFVYGWVPFNVECANKELPVAANPPPAGHAIIDYIAMQYNYKTYAANPGRWFNPYTQLIHADLDKGGLDASAYAFSIDDHASFLSNSGGSLSGGLIFAVGGAKGLQNGVQHAPPVPQFFPWYDFAIGLGTPDVGKAHWTKYGLCSDTANTLFPTESKAGFTLSVDPAQTPINAQKPCPITLQDSAGRKYQIVVLKATPPGTTLPQAAMWPAFTPAGDKHSDPAVISCPTKTGFVAPKDWCTGVNELAQPSAAHNAPGNYSLSTPPPLN